MTFCDFSEFFAAYLSRVTYARLLIFPPVVTAYALPVVIWRARIISRNYLRRSLGTRSVLSRIDIPRYRWRRHVPGRHLWLLQIAMPTCHTVRGASCSRQAGLTCRKPFNLTTTDRPYPRWSYYRRRGHWNVTKINDLQFFARHERLFLHEGCTYFL